MKRQCIVVGGFDSRNIMNNNDVITLIQISVSALSEIVEDRLAEPHICAMIQTEIQRLHRVAYFLAKEASDPK